jgi:hypothetical protein
MPESIKEALRSLEGQRVSVWTGDNVGPPQANRFGDGAPVHVWHPGGIGDGREQTPALWASAGTVSRRRCHARTASTVGDGQALQTNDVS